VRGLAIAGENSTPDGRCMTKDIRARTQRSRQSTSIGQDSGMGITRNPDPAAQPGRGPRETIRVPLRRVRVLIHVVSLCLRARVHYRLHPWNVEILLLLEVWY